MTKEEKILILEQGIQLLEQAKRLDAEIKRTFKKIGVVVCGGATTIRDSYSGKSKYSIHVYKGIKKLAYLLDEELYHPDFYGDEQKNQLAIVHGDYELFECGEKISRGYSYR